jgi:hypothetical protein
LFFITSLSESLFLHGLIAQRISDAILDVENFL